ncbi:MAG TPA: neutral/alkaline non-lysosomal ceramidase N-terminal domain-containing protein [Tepidisphaeraceae bacterium]|nr:neutral/alkaline non-lysosomal ceramidase N-terminal domain-containing protein [Tepidisphaeraceae bacterium]
MLGAEPSADWQAGVAAVRITPPKPVPLAGYAARTKPFTSVEQEIEAKSLALKDAQGNTAVLITLDLCILPPDVGQEVRSRIAEKTHLEPAAILLNVAHSHSAPAVGLHPTTGPSQPNPTEAGTIEYTKWLEDRIVESAEQSIANLRPAKLSWGTGVCSFVMNRRQFTEKGVILGVNPRGLVDRSVPVLRIDGADGKPRAILFGYACHNTTNPSSSLAVGGDYEGYAKSYVQEHVPGAMALYMTGCAGDSNPFPRVHPEDARKHGAELGEEVCRVLETKLTPVHGPLKCAMITADLPLQTPGRESLQEMTTSTNGLKKQYAKESLAVLDAGAKLPGSYHPPVEAWQFGTDLTLVALPDEVVVAYLQDLERAIGPLKLWVAGYCQEVAGYIPSERILHEGGYETRGLYIGTGWFAPGVEESLVKAATEAAEKAGRTASH